MDSFPNLQQSCNTLHRQSISQSPVLFPPPPYVETSDFPPPYLSLVDESTAYWWEAGAEDILRRSDLYAIQLVCRFQTYGSRIDPGSILRTRWDPILDFFLLRLRPGEGANVVDLDKDQKVEEILKLLLPSLPPSDHLEEWPPDEVFNEPDTSRAALRLEDASNSKFKKISFSNWARAARDTEDYVDSVEDFIDWHNGFCVLLCERLKSIPGEMDKYAQIEMMLPEQSPARWSVSRSIQLVQSNQPITDAQPPQYESTLRQLQDCFGRLHQDPVTALRELAVLDVRYQHLYLGEAEIDWSERFEMDVDFFQLVITTSPQELADTLTDLDFKEFPSLHRELDDNIINGPQLQYMNRRWNKLCKAAQESVIVEEHLSSPVADLAKASAAQMLFDHFS